MDKVKIALAADVHLGTSFSSYFPHQADVLQEAQEKSLANLCKYCEQHAISLLFLAGDLFDQTNPDKALLRRTQQSFLLCPTTSVYIVPGNHDPYFPASIWDDEHWPDNVNITKTAATCWQVQGKKLRIYSEPFVGQSAEQSLLTELRPAPDPAFFNILLIHGELVSAGGLSRYNPLPREWLAQSGLDLVILGHRHTATDLLSLGSSKVIYPGALMGRGFDELGSKGFYAGTLAKKKELYGSAYTPEIQLRFVPLQQVGFYRLDLQLRDGEGLEYDAWQEQVLNQIQLALKQEDYPARKQLISLTLLGRSEFAPDLNYLHNQLAPDLFYLQLDDQTQRLYDLAKLAHGQGLKAYVARICQQLSAYYVSEDKTAIQRQLPELENLLASLDQYPEKEQAYILMRASDSLFDLLDQSY